MTIETTALQHTIARVQADLARAAADVALYERLKAAHVLHKRLHAHLDELTQQLAGASKPPESNIKDVRISVDDHDGNILRSTYTVSVTRPVYNYRTHGTDDVVARLQGLQRLPDDVTAWLIQHPSRIPAAILALAPNDAADALHQFRAALRRGYFTGERAA